MCQILCGTRPPVFSHRRNYEYLSALLSLQPRLHPCPHQSNSSMESTSSLPDACSASCSALPRARRHRHRQAPPPDPKMSKCVILLAALSYTLPTANAFSVPPSVGVHPRVITTCTKCEQIFPPPIHRHLPPPSHSASLSAKSTALTTTVLRSSSQTDGEFTAPSAKEKALGVLVLLTVPLAWGTYAPVVKYVYEMDPPVPGFVFSAAYYLIASASLLTLMAMSSTNTDEEDPSDVSKDGSMSLPIQGGVELGSYLFLGNCLQVVGLETVPADRAAFLVQLTTIMVPIFQAAFARDVMAISPKTWAACLLAFSGVVVMGFDGKDLSSAAVATSAAVSEGGGSSASSTALTPLTSSLSAVADTFSGGDVLIILAAVAYTMHVVRLGKYAQSTTPLRLAASKASVEAVLSITLISLLVMTNGGALGDTSSIPEFLAKTSGEVTTYLTTFGDSLATAETSTLLPALGACLWTGWVTCAYTIYAQSFGQRRVSPTDANLVRETLSDCTVATPLFISYVLIIITSSSSSSSLLWYNRYSDLYDAAPIFKSVRLCIIRRNSR